MSKYIAIGECVTELAYLQLMLADRQRVPTAKSVGYIFGMFDCATQYAELDLNNPVAQTILGMTLAALFSSKAQQCLDLIGVEQTTETFMAAALSGGADYSQWSLSRGELRPTSLIRLLHCSSGETNYR